MYHIHTKDIRIRDPFIVPCKERQVYYLFGTTDTDPWHGAGEGFLVYESKDLEHWSAPQYAFEKPEGFWATKNFWAPEVHFYGGAWYMFASFKADDRCRGVQILRADQVTGPYLPITDGAVTPHDWECLDGTLFIDDEDRPWIVFSHEWVQIGNGAFCAAPLSEDLTRMTAEPVTLFHAKDAAWSAPNTGEMATGCGENYVTDGPFFYHSKEGELCMLWSSFSKDDYVLGIAKSATGKLIGPWMHEETPRFSFGGHGMVFEDLQGKTWLALHAPNTDRLERLTLIPFEK